MYKIPAEVILLCEAVVDVLKVTILLGWKRRASQDQVTRWFGKEKLENEHLLKIYENFARTEANKLVYRWLGYFKGDDMARRGQRC